MESQLAVDLFKLQAEVGDVAGFGRGVRYGQPAWDSVQQGQIDVCVETCLRWVYQTAEVTGPDGRVMIPADYDWSFLAPRASLTIPAGVTEVALPDDFGGMRNQILPVASGSLSPCLVPMVRDEKLYEARAQSPSQTGRPLMFIVEWTKSVMPDRGQRAKLSLFPTTDAVYTTSVWYDILPNALSTSLPQVYGGAAHAETFLAAVRAAYEDKYLNGGNGKEKATFIERLRASVQRDRKWKPLNLGKNLDHSDVDWLDRRPIGTIHFDYAGITPG